MMLENTLLSGQVALISGGAGDIAGAIARELASRGADIALGDIVPEANVAPLRQELEAMDRRTRYDAVDVQDWRAVRDWVERVESSLRVPSLIIVNAAVATMVNIRDITPDQWNRELNVNLNGAFYLAQAAALRLLEHKLPGRIVFVGSWVGHAPQTHAPAYCTSKAGMRMLSRCMARDLAGDGILVNEVAPGNVDAGLTARIYRENPGERETAEGVIPVGRNMNAQDVAFQVAHLCDPRNRHMTGTSLIADGGLSLLSYPKHELK